MLTVLAGSVDELLPRSLHWLAAVTPRPFDPGWPDHGGSGPAQYACTMTAIERLFAVSRRDHDVFVLCSPTCWPSQLPPGPKLAAANAARSTGCSTWPRVPAGQPVLEIGTDGASCAFARPHGAHPLR